MAWADTTWPSPLMALSMSPGSGSLEEVFRGFGGFKVVLGWFWGIFEGF